jgi:hypothetical protein
MAACRGAALGLAVLLGFNLLEVFACGTESADSWICSLSPASGSVGIVVLAMAATALLLFAMHPALPGPVWMTALGVVLLFCAAIGRDLWNASQILPQSDRTTALIRPVGVLMLLCVAGVGILTGRSDRVRGRSSWLMILMTALITIAAFCIITVQAGGRGDPLPAESVAMIVVVGDPLTADEQLSEVLLDRLRVVATLQADYGDAPVALCGVTEHSEELSADVRGELTSTAGISEDRLILITGPAESAQVIRTIAARPELNENRRVILIAHWYQLARLRLLSRRSELAATLLAADQTHALFNQNLLVAKEVAATLISLADPGVQFLRGVAVPAQPAPPAAEEAGGLLQDP